MGLVRFRSRACRFRTNGTGANSGGRMLCAPTGFRWTVGAAISRPKAFPFRGRCPRRGRMRCAAKGRLRAGQCPAPTERPESSPYFVGAGVLTRPPVSDAVGAHVWPAGHARRARPPGRAAHAIPQGRGVPLPRAGPRPARKPSHLRGEGRFPLSGGNVPKGQKG